MNQQLLMMQGLQPEELALIQELIKDMTDAEQQQFLMIYNGKRKDQQTMLLLCLIGLIGAAGIHRFVAGDIVLGILFLLTGGFCLIGTIIDAINIKNFTYEYNRKQAIEAAQMLKMMKRQ
jgi:TM2 domain-containing membrane protein YozV